MKYNFVKIDAIAFDHSNYMWKCDISCHNAATKLILKIHTLNNNNKLTTHAEFMS